MTRSDERPVLLFDGVCTLCDGAVLFVIDRDPHGLVAFAPLQSRFARERLEAAGSDPEAPASIVLLEGDRVSVRSTAVLRVAGRLRAPWSWLRILMAVPRPWRDAAYDLVARHRFRLFGRRAACRIPTPELARRFVAVADDA